MTVWRHTIFAPVTNCHTLSDPHSPRGGNLIVHVIRGLYWVYRLSFTNYLTACSLTHTNWHDVCDFSKNVVGVNPFSRFTVKCMEIMDDTKNRNCDSSCFFTNRELELDKRTDKHKGRERERERKREREKERKRETSGHAYGTEVYPEVHG